MKTYKQVVKEQSSFLKEVTHIPVKEVELLLLHLVEKNTIWLHINYDKPCECEQELKKLVQKRATHYPLEYLTKKASFYGEVFEVEAGVLIPRPETEILVEKAQELLKTIESSKVANSGCETNFPVKVIEIGVGSGVISVMLALLIKDIQIVAVDINEKALSLAKRNAIKHKVDHKILFIESDLLTNIPDDRYDMVVSNPPYIAKEYQLPKNVQFEPNNALVGGDIGDELLQKIINQSAKREIPYLLCEMGYDQKEPLQEYIIKNYNNKKTIFYKDYEGFDRGFILKF